MVIKRKAEISIVHAEVALVLAWCRWRAGKARQEREERRKRGGEEGDW